MNTSTYGGYVSLPWLFIYSYCRPPKGICLLPELEMIWLCKYTDDSKATYNYFPLEMGLYSVNKKNSNTKKFTFISYWYNGGMRTANSLTGSSSYVDIQTFWWVLVLSVEIRIWRSLWLFNELVNHLRSTKIHLLVESV